MTTLDDFVSWTLQLAHEESVRWHSTREEGITTEDVLGVTSRVSLYYHALPTLFILQKKCAHLFQTIT